MVDMAVGIIMGGAIGKVVASLVGDVIMPVVGKAMGGVDFSNLYVNLGEGTFANMAVAEAAGAPLLKYGAFVQSFIDFLILAFVIFLMIKKVNSLKKKEEAVPAAPPANEVLLGEIRDLLKK